MPIKVTYTNQDNDEEYDSFVEITQIPNFNLVSEIDCSNNELISLPDNMNFPNLHEFYCYNNRLTSLQALPCGSSVQFARCAPAFGTNMNFPNLQIFYCYNNRLMILPDIMNFNNLLEFDCCHNLLRFIPDNMNLPNLHCLDCSNNQLISLPDNMNFPNLYEFDCHNNQLTSLPNNMNFSKLEKFYCYNNKLTVLPDNINFPNLQEFYCSNNQLISFSDFATNMNFPNLQEFICYMNQLTSLPDNMNFPNLINLDCSHNQLTSLPDNMNLPNLQKFNCSKNKLTSLPNMNFINLQHFDCYKNKLTSLPVCILNFRNLRSFSYYGNEIELSLQIARFIDRIKNNTFSKIELAVYNDTQNVHNSTIQLCVRDSINRITTRTDLKKYNIDQLHTLIIENTILTETSKSLLFEYVADTTVHSLLLLTFSEVLWFIIQTILTDFQTEQQEEIFNVLNQEILDADCKCFTGRMNRVINCLNGFSPFVSINIKDGEQIGNIIILVKNKLELTGTYTIEQHKTEVEKELLERNYDIETIKTWLEYID